MINIGSCGLHIVHNAFKSGMEATEWKLDHLLFCLFQLFKDTPACRHDYASATSVTNSIFPLKFCKIRWVENVFVLERALSILPDLTKYINSIAGGKYPDPSTKSFEAAKDAYKDALTCAILQFALPVSKQVTSSLQFYQTDKPVLPFIADDLLALLKSLMMRFVKKEIMDTVKSIDKLLEVDVSDKETHATYNVIDVGFVSGKKIERTSGKEDH